MTALGLAARWIQLLSGLGLLGVFTALLIAGPSERRTARAWAARMRSLGRALVAVALFSSVLVLAHQATVVAGRGAAALEPPLWLLLLTESRFGTVWLVRSGLLLLLAAFILLCERERSSADAVAWRLEGWTLSAAAVAATAWAGHAAATLPEGGAALLANAVHQVAVAAWLGALFPLAQLLRAASTEAGADARPYAVLAIRRFSALAVWLMLVIIATGLGNAWVEVGDAPALVGTRYGAMLLAKLALLAPIAAVAFANRRLLPALSGEGTTVGRPAMVRIARLVRWELALAALVLGVSAALSLTVPAAHDTPRWPFALRLSYDAGAALPGTPARLFIGSQLAFLGLLGAIIGALVRRGRALLVAAGALALVAGLAISLPPLAIDAYPTTYRRAPVAYQVASIARGMALYESRCAVCHGASARGDGPAAAGLPRRPADLTGPHTGQHTAGDLYWWITHGIRSAGMPPFRDALTEDERWDLVNLLRVLAAGAQARGLSPRVERERPWLVAPDFTFAVGPTPPRTLRELRDRFMVLLVLFSLPDSRPRLGQLARAYGDLEQAGTEVLAIPVTGEPGIIGRVGGDPPVLFPIATEGGAEIVATYALLSRTTAADAGLGEHPAPPHAEFLLDRQGYIRARWIPDGRDPRWNDLPTLMGEIRTLDRETPAAPAPDEHVH
jgi:putative copper export protein/mono/diheme cytochrome c family protein